MTDGPATLRIVRLPHSEGLAAPCYETPGSAGMDVRAAVGEPVEVPPGQVALIPTGFRMEVPVGYEVQVRPRSGLALRKRVTLLNSPGTIDSDYRGEVQVILVNLGDQPFVVERGDRIAQLVLAPVARAEIVESGEITETARGTGGFGHTGRS